MMEEEWISRVGGPVGTNQWFRCQEKFIAREHTGTPVDSECKWVMYGERHNCLEKERCFCKWISRWRNVFHTPAYHQNRVRDQRARAHTLLPTSVERRILYTTIVRHTTTVVMVTVLLLTTYSVSLPWCSASTSLICCWSAHPRATCHHSHKVNE